MSFILGGTSLRPIRAVLFDMDGLLIDSERIAMECDRRAFTDMGIDMPYDVLLSTLGETAAASNQIFASHMNIPFNPDRFWPLTQKHYAELIGAGKLSAKPGAIELLDELDRLSIPHALASSSGTRRIALSLCACNLTNRFSVIACGDDPIRSKPEPDIFLLADHRLLVQPQDCLVLEDSLSGIQAGRRGGMQVCMVPDLLPWQETWTPFCDHVCTTLLDVIELLHF